MKSEHFDTVSGDFQEFIKINTAVVYFVTLWVPKFSGALISDSIG